MVGSASAIGPADLITAGGMYWKPELGKIFQTGTTATAAVDDGDPVQRINDSGPNGNNVTSSGVPAIWRPARPSLEFVPSDRLRYDAGSGGFWGTGAGTMFSRFRQDAAGESQCLIGCRSGSSPNFRHASLFTVDGAACGAMGTQFTSVIFDPSSTDLRSATDFHTIGMTWGATAGVDDVALYVDGVEVYRDTRAGDPSENASMSLGCRTGPSFDNYFDGEISHWWLDKRQISAAEMLGLHNAVMVS